MRRIRTLLAATALVALAASASAEYVPYSQIRKDNAVVDDAIAALPSSDLNGTLNRISALMTRAPIRDLAAGSDPADLPENFVRNLTAAIEDLRQDLEAIDAFWETEVAAGSATGVESIDNRWVVAQLVDRVLIARTVELNEAGIPVACGTSEPDIDCPYTSTDPANPELLNTASQLFFDDGETQVLWNWMEDFIQYWDDEGQPPTFSEVGTNVLTFEGRVGQLDEASVYIPGVPSIDD